MGFTGKIERLPKALRDELGVRLLDGASFREISTWINSEPEAVARWDQFFKGAPLEDHNLSEWKTNGGFARWKEGYSTSQLAERCMVIANASGGKITRGAATILGGQIMAALETLAEDRSPDDEEGAEGKPSKQTKADKLLKLAMALKMGAEAEAIPVKTDIAQGNAKRAQDTLDLNVQKFRRDTAALFLKFYEDKRAKEIAAGDTTKDRKLDQLVLHFWGEMPENIGPQEK